MVELLPPWCADPEVIPTGMVLGPWLAAHVMKPMTECDGDDWHPGVEVTLERRIDVDRTALERYLDLPFGRRVGMAARWYCATTSRAGVHVEGPAPVEVVDGEMGLRLRVGAAVAGSLHVETYVVVIGESGGAPTAGSTVWCDSWSSTAVPKEERTMLLEGDQLRPRVRIVDFSQDRKDIVNSPFHIDIDAGAGWDDHVANVMTIEINEAVTTTPDDGDDDEPTVPDLLVGTVRVAWLRAVADRFLVDDEAPEDSDDGTLGWLALDIARMVGGTWSGAVALLRDDPQRFESGLWHAYVGVRR